MNLTLNDDDARTLRDLLEASLPGLRWETARTDHSDALRQALLRRLALSERLLEEMSATTRDA